MSIGTLPAQSSSSLRALSKSNAVPKPLPSRLQEAGLSVSPLKATVSKVDFNSIGELARKIYLSLKDKDNSGLNQELKLSENIELKSLVEDSRLSNIQNGAEVDLFGSTRVSFEKPRSFDNIQKFSFRFSQMQKQPSYASMHKPPEARERILGHDGRHLDGPPAMRVETGSLSIIKMPNGNERLEISQMMPSGFEMKSFELVA
jgi:hypothetical protein